MRKQVGVLVFIIVVVIMPVRGPVFADAVQVSQMIAALPQPQTIIQSTVELRTNLEKIQEEILTQRLSQEDFTEQIWEKWQAVQAKNAYFLPCYETIDISNAANSKAYANPKDPAKTSGRGFDDYFSYWILVDDDTQWRESIALWKDRMVETVGSDQLFYSKSGIPFSFPSEQYYAIGTRGSATRRKLELSQPKAYHSIAFAAVTGNRSNTFDLELRYTTGTCEVHTFTLSEGWTVDEAGNLMNNPGLWADKEEAAYRSDGGGNMGIDWFEIPTDSTRKLDSIVFRDFNKTADYKVLAVTGCTDISQQAKDIQSAEFDGRVYPVDLSAMLDSKISIDPTGEMNRANLDLKQIDYFKYGTYDNSLALDAVEATALLPDGKGTDKRGTVYFTDMTEGITVRPDKTVSVSIEPSYVKQLSFLAGSGGGTSVDRSWLEFVYEDGERVCQPFSIPAGYVTTNANRTREDYFGEVKQYISFGPNNGYTYYPNLPAMGLYSIQVENDRSQKVTEIRFCCSGANIEYKIMALTCTHFTVDSLFLQTEQWMADYTNNSQIYLYKRIRERFELLEMYHIDTETLQGYQEFLQKEQEMGERFSLYVAPNGSDENSGCQESQPLQTFEAVHKKIRQLRSVAEYPITVWLLPGEYRQRLVLEGEWGTEQSPVTFQALGDVRFTGSQRLEDGGTISDAEMAQRIPEEVRDKVLEFDLKAQGIDISELSVLDYDLFLDGKPQPVAQYPNGEDHYAYSEKTVNGSQKGSFTVMDSNVERWLNYPENDAYIGGYFAYDYRYDNALLGTVDPQSKTLTLSTEPTFGIGEHSFRWKVFHMAQELDEPGEWYLNQRTGKLYYYPPCDIEEVALELAVEEEAMITIKDADYITFRGIHFQNSAGAAIYSNRNLNAQTAPSNIVVDNCVFTSLAEGITLSLGVDPPNYWSTFAGGDNIRIENNSFLYMGSHAVSLYGGDQYQLRTNNCVISNNYIYKCARKQRERYAIYLDYTIGTQVKNNVIHRLPASASTYNANDCQIKYNEIYNVLRENEDGGALYSGLSFMVRGNEIAYNYIHDGRPVGAYLRSGASTGIYLDDGLSGQEVHHNIISGFGCGVLLSGQDNKVYSNTIVNSDMLSIMAKNSEYAMAGEKMRAPLENLYKNPNWGIWSEHYPELEETYEDSSQCRRNVIQDNLVDLPLHLTEPFWRPKNNILEDNAVYGFRNQNIFTQDYLVDPMKGGQYLTVGNGILNTENFNMDCIGIKSLSQRIKPYQTFRPLYPAYGAVIENPHDQIFLWEDAAGADCYTLEIACDSGFESVVYRAKSQQNRLRVCDFDFEAGKYYWRVWAENTSRSIGEKWICSGQPMKVEVCSVYQLEKMQKQLDISSYFNSIAMVEENSSNVVSEEYRVNLNYVMNKTYLRSLLDQKGQVSLGETVFAMKLDGEKNAVNNYGEAVTIDVENGHYSHLDFLAGTIAQSGRIQILYQDGSVQNDRLEFDTSGFGRLFSASLDLRTGQPNGYESGIYTARVKTDCAKQVDRIVLQPVDSLDAALNLFSVTAFTADTWETKDGTVANLILENRSSQEKETVLYRAEYENNGKLCRVQRENLRLNAREQIHVLLLLPQEGVLRQFIWNDVLEPEAQAWHSE